MSRYDENDCNAAGEDEVLMVLTRMQQFPEGSPDYLRFQKIWHMCSGSGALREDFPPGTEVLRDKWEALMREAREAVQ